MKRHIFLEELLISRLKNNFSEVEKSNRAKKPKKSIGIKGAVNVCIVTGALLIGFSYGAENFLENSLLTLILSFIGKVLLLAGSSYWLLLKV